MASGYILLDANPQPVLDNPGYSREIPTQC